MNEISEEMGERVGRGFAFVQSLILVALTPPDHQTQFTEILEGCSGTPQIDLVEYCDPNA